MSRLTESLKDIKNDPPTPLNLTPEERLQHKKEIMELHRQFEQWMIDVKRDQEK